jgi:hypothetical protein
MNYRVLVDEKLLEFRSKIPGYTYTQTVLTVLKQMDGFQDFQKSDLLTITDEQFYSAIESAIRKEGEKHLKYKD